MDKDKDVMLAELEEDVKALPKSGQKAVCWAIKNLELVKNISIGMEMTAEEVLRQKESALAKKDYPKLAFLYAIYILQCFEVSFDN